MDQLISDAKFGIGKIEYAFHVQQDGFSTQTKSVFLYLTIVIPMMHQELASLAIRDMIYKISNASYHHQMEALQTKVVQHGIGISKYASNAQRDTHSILKDFVYQFLIIAINIVLLVSVLHAIRDLT